MLGNVTLRQFDKDGRGLDCSSWFCRPFELHILMFDILVQGCVRFQVTPRYEG